MALNLASKAGSRPALAQGRQTARGQRFNGLSGAMAETSPGAAEAEPGAEGVAGIEQGSGMKSSDSGQVRQAGTFPDYEYLREGERFFER